MCGNVERTVCNKVTCSACERCIYDEGNVEDIIKQEKEKKMEAPSICNNCEYLIKTDTSTSYTHKPNTKYYNVYCKKKPDTTTVTKGKNIAYLKDVEEDIKCPNWCPLNPNAVKETYTNPSLNKHKAMFDRWNSITRKLDWDSIKVGEIYHLPPYMGFERRDVIIVSKSNSQGTYREITKPTTTTPTTFYPTSIMLKFLVKSKLKEYKQISK